MVDQIFQADSTDKAELASLAGLGLAERPPVLTFFQGWRRGRSPPNFNLQKGAFILMVYGYTKTTKVYKIYLEN